VSRPKGRGVNGYWLADDSRVYGASRLEDDDGVYDGYWLADNGRVYGAFRLEDDDGVYDRPRLEPLDLSMLTPSKCASLAAFTLKAVFSSSIL